MEPSEVSSVIILPMKQRDALCGTTPQRKGDEQTAQVHVNHVVLILMYYYVL